MIKELHIAAQYLAAAAINFVKKEADDSHTNLGWSNERNTLLGRALNETGDSLSLNFNNFSLEWNSDSKSAFLLAGKSHQAAVDWISSKVNEAGISIPYNYQFHYEMDNPTDMNSYSFPQINQEEINRISGLLSIAQNSIGSTLTKQKLNSEIRIWPHHFDIGAYAIVSDNLAIGFGLAIPDGGINEFYYYISGYKGEDYIETKNFKPLSIGEWQTEDWKAGTLKANNINESQAITFLNETINEFRT